MRTFEFTIKLTLQAPIFTAAQGGRSFGVDSAFLRDQDNRPAIPGTLIRGNLRHAWTTLAQFGLDIDIEKWLGKGDYTGGRSRMVFSHWFSTHHNETKEKVRYRIQINDKGTVENNMLQVIESPFNVGEDICFEGHVWAKLDDGESPETLKDQLCKGLQWIPAIGALKGVGFGKLKSVEVEHREKTANITLKPQQDQDVYGLTLTFDRPICFSKPQIGRSENNIFESESFVPGAAIIAVLATALKPAGLKEELNQIRVTHAFPSRVQGVRPVPIPHSWAETGDGKLSDVSACTSTLIQGKAPAFQVDWKYPTLLKAEMLCGWPSLNKVIETHTGIHPDTNIAAQSQLFSMECLDNRNTQWLANISFSAVAPDKQKLVKDAVFNLFNETVWPWGKTDARAEVIISKPHGYALTSVLKSNDLSASTLTLTLMTATELLYPIPDPDAINSSEDWREAYNGVFKTLSQNSLSVERCLTRELLVGGRYLQHKFAMKHYCPRLLTQSGSVFVLRVNDADKARTCLDQWLQQGLPSLRQGGWETNPYIPQNGYGEIAINLQLPKEGKA